MNKTETLKELNRLTKEIVNADKFRDHQDCVAYSCRGGFCIEFNELQKVTIPNNGIIHTLDTNNMVLLEFENTLGTTDWLPLAMFDDKIISNLYEVIKDMHKELVELVYILHCNWSTGDDSGNEVIKVFKEKEAAIANFDEFLTNEVLNTWLCDFVDENGHLYDDQAKNIEQYEYIANKSFYLEWGDHFTHIFIKSFQLY